MASAPAIGHVAAPHKATTSPIVTGASVLAIKYADGVMLAADTLGSYGSLARYTELRRIRRVGDYTLVAASGEYSDLQFLMDALGELVLTEHVMDDGAKLSAPEIHSYITRLMYQKRNKMDPLWNTVLVAGVKDGKASLGYTDLRGTAFTDNFAATGYGAYMALPLIRERWRADMDEGAARALLEDCMRVLWYRDTRALNKIQIAKITHSGGVAGAGAGAGAGSGPGPAGAAPLIAISDPYVIDAKWDYKSFVKPKADADTGGSW